MSLWLLAGTGRKPVDNGVDVILHFLKVGRHVLLSTRGDRAGRGFRILQHLFHFFFFCCFILIVGTLGKWQAHDPFGDLSYFLLSLGLFWQVVETWRVSFLRFLLSLLGAAWRLLTIVERLL
jgi:hypothetical protein